MSVSYLNCLVSPWLTVCSSWEMTTIGHPVSDIANLLQPFRIGMEGPDVAKQLKSPQLDAPGLPSVSECLCWYSHEAGWDPHAEIIWADAFSLFRGAVVRQGIAARYAARQASSSSAYEYGEQRMLMASLARKAIEGIKHGKNDKRRERKL